MGQSLFPPRLTTANLLKTIPFQLFPQYRDPHFLHQKYTVEGLTPAQIAELTFSSRTCVNKHLRLCGIALRTVDETLERWKSNPGYGQYRSRKGIVAHKRERKAISQMQRMLKQGLSYRECPHLRWDLLEGLMVSTLTFSPLQS